MVEKYIILVICISFSIQIFYFIFFYFRVTFFVKYIPDKKVEVPVSVIISARNEFENLKTFLPIILKQEYADFQLVVVNDRSSDATAEFLDQLSKLHESLKVIHVKDNNKNVGKKNALEKGIKASKHEYLIFTDADCYPVSKKWISEIMSVYDKDTKIVLAYGAYKESSGFLNKLIRFETSSIAIQYLSFAKAGMPYMGVGRNLSYKKSLFLKHNGFESHKNILSGDDDLFINEVADKKNTKVSLSYKSITKSIPKKTLKDYLKQKKRHLTTGKHYKPKFKILLAVKIFSGFFFYTSILIMLAFKESVYVALIFYLVRMFIQIIIIGKFSANVKEKQNLIFIPIFDVLIPVFNLYAVISNKFNNNKKWN